MQPKVFISYSWSSPGHQALVEQWAEQLVDDGIDVVLDIYDLKEDKNFELENKVFKQHLILNDFLNKI